MLISREVEQKLKTLPKSPGVYIMRDQKNEVIYVGKARVLANRVRQYFGSAEKPAKVMAMVENIHDFEYIMVDNEVEALVLESNLIKQYQPYYNILLRDDKHFPYVRIDLREAYPAIQIVRRVANDGAKYFGPFLAAHSIREILDAVYKLFPVRSCKRDLSVERKNVRPCLNYQMGRCMAPCCGKVSAKEYRVALDGVIELLSGRRSALEKQWSEEMMAASEALDFERAAVLRDKIALLRRIGEKQKAGFPDLHDSDVFAVAQNETDAVVQAFFVRAGKLSQAERFYLDAGEDAREVLESFLKQYYTDKNAIPKQIYVSEDLTDGEIIGEWLSQKRGSRVNIIRAQRGDNRKLCEMAQHNAKEALTRKEQNEKREFTRTKGAARALGDALGIGYVRRMECYDISNTQGTDSVASMVVFTDGKPDKGEYRRFRIKTVQGANDFASMEEVLTRRLTEGFHAEEHSTGFGVMPDLIVIDGGKGQLGMAVGVLESMGLEDVAIIGLAKREEEVFLPHRSDPIIFAKGTPALKLLTGIRDEAHRFAITYHRNLRAKRVLTSELDGIAGIGPKRKKILIDCFGDIAGIREATLEELMQTRGIDATTARSIYRYFHE